MFNMKQKYISQIVLLLLTFFFIDCTQSKKSENTSDKTILTVTIDPQRYILEHIIADNFTINTLVPPGTSPETYEPAPSVMVDMGKSKMYYMVGDLGFEKAWSKRLAENNPNIKIVDCSKGIELIKGKEHNHTDENGHTHSHGELDPHIWSSPTAVKVMSENMVNSLIEFDPDNRELYQNNYEIFINKVDSTDSIIRELLNDIPTRSFIIFHPALGYFAQEFDLHQYSIEFEGKNPSPAQIKMLIDIAAKEKINTVFIQKGFDEKNAEVLARQIGAEIFEINPMGYDWDIELINIAEILSRDKSKF